MYIHIDVLLSCQEYLSLPPPNLRHLPRLSLELNTSFFEHFPNLIPGKEPMQTISWKCCRVFGGWVVDCLSNSSWPELRECGDEDFETGHLHRQSNSGEITICEPHREGNDLGISRESDEMPFFSWANVIILTSFSEDGVPENGT